MGEQVPDATEQCERGIVDDNGYCFGCSNNNPIGLHLHFEEEEGGVRAAFTAVPQHQGYAGLLHGGLVAALIDEAIAWAVSKRYGPGVTGEFHMRHRHPVPVGVPLIVNARVIKRRLSMVEAEGQIVAPDGKTLADGWAKFMLVKQV